MLIPCPWCGHREESEFSYGGDASLKRPAVPSVAPDEVWDHYVYLRDNIKGRHIEFWYHTAGCRRWFTATRNTLTHEIDRTASVVTTAGPE